MAESANAYDLRYEYMNQDQPMFGSRKVSAGEVPAHHDEVSTRKRNLVPSYSHNFGNRFGVTVSAAAVQRDHLHIHNHHGDRISDAWKFTELNDVRVRRLRAGSGDAPDRPTGQGAHA